MTLTILDVEQRSPEWYAARCGIVTASAVGKLLTFESPNAMTVDCPKCKAGAGTNCISLARKAPTPISTFHPERTAVTAALPPELTVADNETSRTLTAILATERIAGWTEDTPMSSDMWRGVIHEPFAQEHYAKHYGPVETVGLMVEDQWGFSIGYSPDGLVGDDGLLEIKAPRAKTHLLTVLDDKVPAYNMAQLQTGLLVSGRAWVDFVPFVGGLPLWRKRVLPDPAWQTAIVTAVANFETTCAEMVAAYQQATAGLPMTERIDNELGLEF